MSTDFATAPVVARPTSGMLDVAAQREIAEVQAMVMMARRFPRDIVSARDRIVLACARPELAEVALYSYVRGGTEVTGPSIRLAEAIAQEWGNIQFGVRELEQRDAESTIEAYAMDLERITRQNRVFQVPHVRYTKKGGRQAVEDPRDVYEIGANQGARRLRACILGLIPGDIVDAAVRQVELTLRTKADVTPERVKDMLDKFAELGVSKAMIEKRIQRHVDALTPALLVNLGKVYNSLKDGMSGVIDWFEPEPTDGGNGGGAPAPATRTDAVKEALRKSVATPEPHPGVHEENPAPHDAATTAQQDTGGEVATTAEAGEPSTVVDAERAKKDADAALGDRIVKAAKAAALFSKARKVIIGAAVAESLGIDPGEHVAGDLVEKGMGDEVAIWLESQAPS